LVCTFIGEGETILRALCSSVLWQIYQTLYLSLGCRNAVYHSLSGCRNAGLTPQNAGMIWLSRGRWDTPSSALGLQTKLWFFIFEK
jgi:hypothetical protein